VADSATAEAVEATLKQFVDSLNFNQFDQSYMFLGHELRRQLPMEEFRRVFFRTPRLWRLNVQSVGVGSDGKVHVRLSFGVADAFKGGAGQLSGNLVMIEQDAGWKIVGFELG
jgi:hypothetical protein